MQVSKGANQTYFEEGIKLLELAQRAHVLFERQEPREKRKLLNFVLSNCTWKDGELTATLRQPFDLLAQTTAVAARVTASGQARSAKKEIWLGDVDSNHGKRIQSPLSYR